MFSLHPIFHQFNGPFFVAHKITEDKCKVSNIMSGLKHILQARIIASFVKQSSIDLNS